jgi:hypothetical protein
VNLRDFGQPWIPTGEQSGLLMHIAGRKRFVVHAEEKLTAFLELETAMRAYKKQNECFSLDNICQAR